jgi:hypothetical protein
VPFAFQLAKPHKKGKFKAKGINTDKVLHIGKFKAKGINTDKFYILSG